MDERLNVMKTYKLYIGGAFPRTESGRYYKLASKKGEFIASICLSSRKDLRNSIVSNRKVQATWADRSAYNRGQIIYRIAENLEGAKQQFQDLLMQENEYSQSKAKKELEQLIDGIIYLAGWSDKFQQIFSAVNPVSSSHFNFSILEPTGVVCCLNDESISFKNWVLAALSIILSGNTTTVIAPKSFPLSAITFAEILNNSDLPGSVFNILTGDLYELNEIAASHMDINALLYIGDKREISKRMAELSAENVKRYLSWSSEEFSLSPYKIRSFTELKTTWHPIEQIGGAQAGY